MNRYEGIPELLEQFMGESGDCERWITVHELRDRFQLTRYQCTTISGFLRRLAFGRFGRCPYIVTRIERPNHPAENRACRYLVARLDNHREVAGNKHSVHIRTSSHTRFLDKSSYLAG